MNVFIQLDRFYSTFHEKYRDRLLYGTHGCVSAVVFVRFFPIVIIGWSDEVIEWLFAWMVFMGMPLTCGALASISGSNSGKIATKGNRTPQTIFNSIAEILSIIFLGVMTYYGYQLMINAHNTTEVRFCPATTWCSTCAFRCRASS